MKKIVSILLAAVLQTRIAAATQTWKLKQSLTTQSWATAKKQTTPPPNKTKPRATISFPMTHSAALK
ncbi:MAG: hypothetical protein IJR70_04585 [Eubacterium sp.]|nr:hypothetical protein [Eubacterium sp.]